MRILMIGPPGAGKGTQGALIAARFGIPRIAVGDLLRDHVARRTDLGRAVDAHLRRGELVPEEILLCIVGQAMIAARAAGGGYVFDGVPRTMARARAGYKIAMELGMSATVAVHLRAGDTELTRRDRGRVLVHVADLRQGQCSSIHDARLARRFAGDSSSPAVPADSVSPR